MIYLNGMGFLVGHILANKIPLGTSPFGLSRIIEEYNGNVQLIDARSPLEYEGYHVPGAINVFRYSRIYPAPFI